MRLILTCLAICGLFLTPSVTVAQPAKSTAKQTKAGADCARARKRGQPCVLTFGKGDDVGGDVATGEGVSIVSRGEVPHSNLIRLRTSFRDKIIHWADQF